MSAVANPRLTWRPAHELRIGEVSVYFGAVVGIVVHDRNGVDVTFEGNRHQHYDHDEPVALLTESFEF